MQFVAVLTKKTSDDSSWAYHQAIYHKGSVSIAQSVPLIRHAYLGLSALFDTTSIYILHSVEERELVAHYLPELPATNFIELEGPYNLLNQLDTILDHCVILGDKYMPFTVIPLDHASFNASQYFGAIRVSQGLAEQSGSPVLLGNIAVPNGHPGASIIDQETIIGISDLAIAVVKDYVPADHRPSPSKHDPGHTSWDCGVLSWRAAAATDRLRRLAELSTDERTSVLSFGHAFDWSTLNGVLAVKGEFAFFDASSQNAIELIPYGTRDQNGNVFLSSIEPHNAQALDLPSLQDYSQDKQTRRIDVDPSSSLGMVQGDLDPKELRKQIEEIERDPGFEQVVKILRRNLDID